MPDDPYQGVTFPLDSFREAAIHLRRPFTPQAVKFKLQTQFGEKGALAVGYIDARLVVERLNLIVPHLWRDAYVAVDGNTLRCDLTVDEITRSDVGQGVGKAAYSDALKRAGVKFGVGVSLYAVPQAQLWLNQHGKHIELTDQKDKHGKRIIRLKDEGDTALRKRYEKWLDERGREAFGPALDHGDVEVSVGDPDAVETAEPDAEQPISALVEGDRADELRRRARDAHLAIVANEGRAKFPKGQFEAGLESAGSSLESLDVYVAELEKRAARQAVTA